ncbi:MAG: serine/threonine protein kinase [Sandaracinaceae bacterium]
MVRETDSSGTLSTFEATHDDGRGVRLRVVAKLAVDSTVSAQLDDDLRRLSRLRHPNLDIPIAWSAQPPLHVSTERSPSAPLRAVCDEAPERHLPYGVAAWIGADVAAALIAAHGAGVVHAGLSLDCVLVGADGRARVTDFGLMRCMNGRASAGQPSAAIESLAPEQLTSPEAVTPATDVFALGLVLYRCLTGAFPFEASSPLGISIRLSMGRQTPIDAHGIEIEDELKALVTAMLASDPDYRPTLAFVQKTLTKHAGPRKDLVRELIDRGPASSASGVRAIEPSPEYPRVATDPHCELPPMGQPLSSVELAPPAPREEPPTPRPVPHLWLVHDERPSQKPPPPFVVDDAPTSIEVGLPTEMHVRALDIEVGGGDTSPWPLEDEVEVPRTLIIEAPPHHPRVRRISITPAAPPSLPMLRDAAPLVYGRRPVEPPSLGRSSSDLAPSADRASELDPVALPDRAPPWAIWTAVALGAFALLMGATSFAMMLAG